MVALSISYRGCVGHVLRTFEKDLPNWTWAFIAIFISGFTYLTFQYLLLSITAFTKKSDILIKVWSWRTRWAIVHGFIILVIKVYVSPHIHLN